MIRKERSKGKREREKGGEVAGREQENDTMEKRRKNKFYVRYMFLATSSLSCTFIKYIDK